MGLDMYIYNARKESELNFDEDWNEKTNPVLYFRSARELHYVLEMFAKRTDREGYYSLDKSDMIKLLNYFMSAIMRVYASAITAYNDCYKAENYSDEHLSADRLALEYFAAGKAMNKKIDKEIHEGVQYNPITLFDEDEDGSMLVHLVNGIMSLLEDMNDDDTITYLASY